jgi:hypothetical protein
VQKHINVATLDAELQLASGVTEHHKHNFLKKRQEHELEQVMNHSM